MWMSFRYSASGYQSYIWQIKKNQYPIWKYPDVRLHHLPYIGTFCMGEGYLLWIYEMIFTSGYSGKPPVDTETATPYDGEKEKTHALYMVKKRSDSKGQRKSISGPRIREIFKNAGIGNAGSVRVASGVPKERNLI